METSLTPSDDVLEYERKAGASSNSRRQSTKGTKAKHIVGELDTENEAEEDSENEEPESPVVKRKVRYNTRKEFYLTCIIFT